MSSHPDAVDFAVSSAADRQKQQRRDTLREDIKRAGALLSTDEPDAYIQVAIALHDRILPTLSAYTGRSVFEFDGALVGDEAEWHYDALRLFDTEGERWRDELSRIVAAFESPDGTPFEAKRQIEQALKSASAVAANEGVVLDKYAARVDAVGFATKLGENYQDQEMDIGDPVKLVSERSGALKTLYTGGTGNGKSVALEREAEDYYARNFEDGRDFKIIDPAGLRDGENWFYDVPLQDGELRHARSDLDLPEDFVAADRDHKIEILVPLTTDLAQQRLPYDVDGENFVVRPFTIPAADIRKSLLVSILTAKLTPEQESVIRDAYSEVDDRRSDWALADLADEIRTRDELGADKRKPPIRTLRQLQNRGFIRTRDCEYALDWSDIFDSTERYTTFSQSLLESSLAQLIVFGYLAHSIVKKRETLYEIPECVVVMRELWKVAPHNRRQEFDERAAQLQEAIGHMLSRLFRDNRHSGVHVLADTQQPTDLLKPVREMFNRYVVFQTNQDITKDIFEWTANDNWRSFYNTLTAKPGEASVVGMVEPAIENRRIQFVGPVKYAPASHHHKLDQGRDSNGWRARSKYFSPTTACPECDSAALDRSEDGYTITCEDCGAESIDISGGRDEVLRRPTEMGVDWPFEVPTKLLINQETSTSKPDPAMHPVAAFADRCLEYDTTESVVRDHVKAAFNAWVIDHDDINRDEPWDFDDKGVQTRFGDRLKDAFEGEIGDTTKHAMYAYKHLTLTDLGIRYAEENGVDFAEVNGLP